MSAPQTVPLDLPAHLFTAIDHVGVAVPDLDEAIAFYRDTFGMQVAHEETNEEQGVREAMVAVGDSGSCIQLLAPLDRELDDREVPRPLRPGHPADGLPGRPTSSRSRAILRERGLRLLYDEPRRGTSDSRINFIHPKDAGGVLVELVEPAGRRTETTLHIRCHRVLPTGIFGRITDRPARARRTTEHDVQHILDAILAGDTSARGLRRPSTSPSPTGR